MSTYVQMYSEYTWYNMVSCVYEENGDMMVVVKYCTPLDIITQKVCRYMLLMMVPILTLSTY